MLVKTCTRRLHQLIRLARTTTIGCLLLRHGVGCFDPVSLNLPRKKTNGKLLFDDWAYLSTEA